MFDEERIPVFPRRLPLATLACLLLAGLCTACSPDTGVHETSHGAPPVSTITTHNDGWDAYWAALKTAQRTVDGGKESGRLRELLVEHAPATVFGKDDATLRQAADALSEETARIKQLREQAERQQQQDEARQRAQQAAQPPQQKEDSSAQTTAQGMTSQPQPAQQETAASATTGTSAGGYTTNSGCTDVDSCQSVIDNAGANVMTPYHTAGGSTYYGIHNSSGGAAMLGQDSVAIDGQTRSLGAWTMAPEDAEGYPIGPDDGRSYAQTCGPDGNVYIAPIL